MKIFEFHFNPSIKSDLIFASFCYEPADAKEQKLGSLYIVGELKNAIPQNSRLIHNLALLLRREYYFSSSPEQGIKKALKKANDFLSDRTKTGNVSWLGNLSLAVVSLHNFDLNFSKDGKIKMLLLRPDKITDIGRNFDIEEFEPYPLKIFTNIVNGKFLENDKVLLLTDQVFEIFLKTGFLEKISLVQDQKTLKELFKAREKEFSEISGICFLLLLSKEDLPKSALTFKKISAPISLKEVLAPLFRFFSGKSFKKLIPKVSLPKISLPKISKPSINLKTMFNIRISKLKMPAIKLPRLSFSQVKKSIFSAKNVFDFKNDILRLSLLKKLYFIYGFILALLGRGIRRLSNENTRKNLFLIFLLFSLMAIGFLFSKREAEIKLADFRDKLIDVQEEIVKAQGYLVLSQDEKADILFKEAFKKVLPLAKNNSPIRDQADTLKYLVEKNLIQLNKVEEVPDPKVIFNFSDKGFSPQRLVLFNNSLYFFSPFQKGMARLSNNDLEKIDAGQVFSFAVPLSSNLALFTKPDQLSIFDGNQIKEIISLELLNQDGFISLSSFSDNLYFLEEDTGRVVQYKQLLLENAGQPNYTAERYIEPARYNAEQYAKHPARYWIRTKEKKSLGAESITVLESTGLVYILTKDNSIWRYRDGAFDGLIELSVFPFPRNLTKLVSSPLFSGFAILEPSQGRIILIDKQGTLIKQFKSNKFVNLKDVVFSQDGKSLYVLSGSDVYKLGL